MKALDSGVPSLLGKWEICSHTRINCLSESVGRSPFTFSELLNVRIGLEWNFLLCKEFGGIAVHQSDMDGYQMMTLSSWFEQLWESLQ